MNDPEYEKWFAEVLRIGKLLGWKERALASMDKDAWRDYFIEGLTPAEAWREEYEAAQ